MSRDLLPVWLYLHAFVCDNTFACLCIDMCMCECLFVLYIVVHIGLVHFILSVNWYIYIHTQGVICRGGGGYPPPLLVCASLPLLNDKIICDTRSEVSFLIKLFAKCALVSRSESNDSRSDWCASKQWIILRLNGLNDSVFQKALLTMFFVRFFYIHLFDVWITGKIKSLQLIGLTYNVFY